MNHKIHCPWEFGEVPAFPGSRHGSKDGLGPEQKLAALTAFGCEVSWLLWPCLGGGWKGLPASGKAVQSPDTSGRQS